MGRVRYDIKDNFTVIHNEYLQDPRMGISEIGMLTVMLSLPDNWDFSIEGLVHRFGKDYKGADGKSKIITALNKLKSFGYFHRIKLIDSKTHRIVDYIYEFSDIPHPNWIEAGEVSEFVNAEELHEKRTENDSMEELSDNAVETVEEVIEEDIQYHTINESVKKQVEYDKLCEIYQQSDVDHIITVLIDVMIYKGKIIRIGQKDYNTSEIKEMYSQINYDHIRKIIEKSQGKCIRSYTQYIRTSLYNAIKGNAVKNPAIFRIYDNDTVSFYAEAVESSFNNEQMLCIEKKIIEAVPYSIESENDVEAERFNYLSKLYMRMNEEGKKKKISDKFAYLCAMLDNAKEHIYKAKNKKIKVSKKSEPSFDLDAILEYAINHTPTI